jgi:iron complex outermembrane receptor protein
MADSKGARAKRLWLLAGVATVVCGWEGVANAQTTTPDSGQIQEVVVTATKTGASNVQKTPLAISAISSAQVDKDIISDAKDLDRIVPDLAIGQNNAYAEIYIRGVGSNNTFNGSDPDVTVQVDGVYISRPFGQFTNFLDVDRVEVLRGPQGTLYGRNATGGTINIVSILPSDVYHEKVELTGGNANLFQADAYLSGPIIMDRVEASLAFDYTRHDPYIENVVPGVPGTDSADRGTIRSQVLVHVTDKIQAITRADISSEDDSLAGFVTPKLAYDPVIASILGQYDKVALNTANVDKVKARGVSEEIDDAVSSNFTLKSITAFRNNDLNSNSDSDGTDKNLLDTVLNERDGMFSEELNGVGSWQKLNYVVGLYDSRESDRSQSYVTSFATNLRTGLFPKSTDDTWAAFAQGEYHLTDKLTLITGIRYTVETKQFDQYLGHTAITTGLSAAGYPIIYVARKTYNATTPKFGISYQIEPNALLYFSATRGFKSGGFNFSSGNSFQGFAPEYLWSYEGGLKTDFFNKHLLFNATTFYYDYTDLQVQAFIIPGVTDITNAATATVHGVELESEWKPVSHADLGGNISLLDAKYDHYINGTANDTGNYLNNAPKYTVNLYGQYGWEIPTGLLSLRGEYSLVGKEYFTAANGPAFQDQGAYALVNSFLIYQPKMADWRVELWGKNLTNKGYVTATSTTGPADSGHPGDPRTFGIRVSWSH